MRRLIVRLCVLAITIVAAWPGPKAGAGELAVRFSVAEREVLDGGSAGSLLVTVTNLASEAIANLDLRAEGGPVFFSPDGVAQFGDVPAG